MLRLIILLLLWSNTAFAEFRLLDLDYFDMRGARFGANRDPLTPDIPSEDYTGRVSTQFNLRLLEVGYWDNRVHTEAIQSKVQTVGWHWELGIRLTNTISFFHEHHSRHRMDDVYPYDYDGNGKPDKFPVEDSYGIKLIFYVNEKPTRSLLNWGK